MKYISENTSCDFVDGLLKKHILSVYLDGYWQNEAYFKDYASIIKKDFQFCQVNDLRTLSEAEIIKKYHSCGNWSKKISRTKFSSKHKSYRFGLLSEGD